MDLLGCTSRACRGPGRQQRKGTVQRHGGGAGWPSWRGSAVCGSQRGDREAADHEVTVEVRRLLHHEVEPVDVDHGDGVLCSASDLLGSEGVMELRAKV